MERFDVPRLIPIKPCRKDAVEICAGADEEEHDQEEGLEFEDAEHGGWTSPLVSMKG